MPDEFKTDVEKVLTDEQKAVGWVKTHTAWAIALGSFILGALVGHFV